MLALGHRDEGPGRPSQALLGGAVRNGWQLTYVQKTRRAPPCLKVYEDPERRLRRPPEILQKKLKLKASAWGSFECLAETEGLARRHEDFDFRLLPLRKMRVVRPLQWLKAFPQEPEPTPKPGWLLNQISCNSVSLLWYLKLLPEQPPCFLCAQGGSTLTELKKQIANVEVETPVGLGTGCLGPEASRNPKHQGPPKSKPQSP